MSVPLLQTERLVLRQIEEADASDFHAAYGNAKAMRFWDFPASRDVAQTAERIRMSLDVDPKWHGVWAIVRHGTDTCIGMINYHHREPWNRRLELGWILAPLHWRQGLMTEAAKAVLKYCFTTLETHRAEAIIEPDNTASRALAAKLGFVQETGMMRDRLCVAGEFRNVLMYAMLQPNWLRRATQG